MNTWKILLLVTATVVLVGLGCYWLCRRNKQTKNQFEIRDLRKRGENIKEWTPALISNPLTHGGTTATITKIFKIIAPPGDNLTFGAADPFMVSGYVFAELMREGKARLGHIGVAKMSADSDELVFVSVIKESFHLSYPYVFNHRGVWYMIPEAYQSGGILLYESTKFPYKWKKGITISSIDGIDSIPFKLGERWYLFTTSAKSGQNYILVTENFPKGKWSILKKDVVPGRGGGQAIYLEGGNVILPIQPPTEKYGEFIILYEVDRNLKFQELRKIEAPKGAEGLHHLSYQPSTNKFMVDLNWYSGSRMGHNDKDLVVVTAAEN